MVGGTRVIRGCGSHAQLGHAYGSPATCATILCEGRLVFRRYDGVRDGGFRFVFWFGVGLLFGFTFVCIFAAINETDGQEGALAHTYAQADIRRAEIP